MSIHRLTIYYESVWWSNDITAEHFKQIKEDLEISTTHSLEVGSAIESAQKRGCGDLNTNYIYFSRWNLVLSIRSIDSVFYGILVHFGKLNGMSNDVEKAIKEIDNLLYLTPSEELKSFTVTLKTYDNRNAELINHIS